ncbi:MAG TPA: winged helix-turn-helix domain-containing protein [Acidimicrobiales bacterium]|nr:winged helix-turn-helix domain-containing protein [Acidimicrobiales bacterium]
MRPRLVEAVTKSGPAAVVITAPAGYGKTTLLFHLADALALPTAWIDCRLEDAAEVVFAGRLARAVESLTSRGGAGLLVVDDAHLVSGSPSAAALDRVVAHPPSGLWVVVGSRMALGADLGRARVSGALVEIDADDLRFRTWEVEELLRDVYGEPLSPESVAVLARRTKGWAACLQLFHLATSGKAPSARRQVLDNLSSRSRLVRDFLTGNVLEGLPVELRSFLVATSILRRPTGPLCDALLDTDDSEACLAELERRQLFTVRVDGDDAFDYHEVLRSYCLVELTEAVGRAEVDRRFARAGELLEERGDLAGALDAYVSAADRGSVSRLLGTRDGLVSEASDLVDLLPAEWVESDPWLRLARARRLVGRGRLDDARLEYERLTEGDGKVALRAEEDLTRLRWWVLPEPGPAIETSGDWCALIRRATRSEPAAAAAAAAGLPGPMGALAEAVCQLLAGRPDRARRSLGTLSADPSTPPAVSTAMAMMETIDVLIRGTPGPVGLIAVPEFAGPPAIWRVLRACVAAVAQEESRSEDTAYQLCSTARREGDAWGAAAIALVAGLGARRRRADSAEEWLTEAADAFDALGAAVPAAWARTWLAEMAEAGTEALGVEEVGANADIDAKAASALVGTDAAGQVVVIRCFGAFRLETEAGVDLSGLRPRARSLLSLLAAHGGAPVHREQLVDALWPYSSLEAGLRSLQVAVSSIRQTLGPAGISIVREGPSYLLDVPAGGWLDIGRFALAISHARAAVRAGDTQTTAAACGEALMLQSAPLLMAEGPADWVVSLRDAYCGQAAWAASQLAGILLESERPARAAAVCEVGLGLDRYHGGLWSLLIRSWEDAGEPASAQRCRQRYGIVLGELGLPDRDDLVAS